MKLPLDYLPLILALLCAVMAAPVGAGPYLVLFSPWAAREEAVAFTGGTLVGLAKAPLAVFVAGEEAELSARVRAAGALWALGAAMPDWICGADDG